MADASNAVPLGAGGRRQDRAHDDVELSLAITVRDHLTDSPKPNPFATLGGPIMITRRLISTPESENVGAMVIAHKIAHHAADRHPVQALERARTPRLICLALPGASGEAAVQQVLGRAGLLTTLHFYGAMEQVAGQRPVATLDRYQGHTRGAALLFRHLQQRRRKSAAWSVSLRTHPRPSERIAAIPADRAGETGELTPLPPALADLGADRAKAE